MHLREAKLCNDCQEVFGGETCPRCGSEGYPISKWIQPICGMGIKKVEIGKAVRKPKLRLATVIDMRPSMKAVRRAWSGS